MPKRGYNQELEYYARKLKKLQGHRRIRIISSSDSEENSDHEPQIIDEPMPLSLEEPQQAPEIQESQENGVSLPATTESDQAAADVAQLDPEILLALGEAPEESPQFGEKIHDSLACLWLPILRKGLNSDTREKLLKQFLVPENCALLQAPKLNPEISAATSEGSRTRDKRVQSVQQQLGLGITALNRGLSLLLENDGNRVQAIKHLSDSCRLLCDLHYTETQARKKFVTPGLDKSFLTIINDVDRDETLFGVKLSEKIKASKVIEKQGLQIKKPVPTKKETPTPSAPATTSRLRPQGNWTGPPRHSSNRGGRGGSRKMYQGGRKSAPAQVTKPQAQPKSRAATQL